MRVGIAAAAVCAFLLAACATAQTPGTRAAGANPGIFEGSQIASGAGEVPLGAVEGALLGADIGRSLDEADRATALKAEYEALEYGRAGRPIAWRSEATGNSGEIVVGPTYEVNRLDCREYTHTVLIGGRTRVARGNACRQPSGTWRVLQ